MKDMYDHAHEGKMDHSHKMHHEDVTKHGAGHKHHSEDFMKHSAGHEFEQDKVRAMCGGGMAKRK
jgi:hypothetical protein